MRCARPCAGRFGPFFVDMDATGRNLFEDLDADIRSRMAETNRMLGIPEGFSYTTVTPD
ncbi:MAG: hypothetical protein GXP25_25390 [Planctomycetes bacterium]|nr:hypothetical protein [Planctomycetota bacterium]